MENIIGIFKKLYSNHAFSTKKETKKLLEIVKKEIGMTIESIDNIRTAYKLSQKYNLDEIKEKILSVKDSLVRLEIFF